MLLQTGQMEVGCRQKNTQHNSTNLGIKGNVMRESKKARQKAWIDAYKAKLFNVAKACRVAGLDRSTVYRWLENDADFARAVHEAREEKIDYIESKLMEIIAEGDTQAIIFALKTLGKHRGYVERQEVVPVNTPPPSIDVKILLQNPEIRLALETISNEVTDDGQKSIEHSGKSMAVLAPHPGCEAFGGQMDPLRVPQIDLPSGCGGCDQGGRQADCIPSSEAREECPDLPLDASLVPRELARQKCNLRKL